jgi:hypothetical protein
LIITHVITSYVLGDELAALEELLEHAVPMQSAGDPDWLDDDEENHRGEASVCSYWSMGQRLEVRRKKKQTL